MAAIQYTEWKTLETRGIVDPGPLEAVKGTLLVGPRALKFKDYSRAPSYGYDSVSIFPAFHNGERCWVERKVWCPEDGYSASGTQESILSFEDGVRLFLERGVFAFPYPSLEEVALENVEL